MRLMRVSLIEVEIAVKTCLRLPVSVEHGRQVTDLRALLAER